MGAPCGHDPVHTPRLVASRSAPLLALHRLRRVDRWRFGRPVQPASVPARQVRPDPRLLGLRARAWRRRRPRKHAGRLGVRQSLTLGRGRSRRRPSQRVGGVGALDKLAQRVSQLAFAGVFLARLAAAFAVGAGFTAAASTVKEAGASSGTCLMPSAATPTSAVGETLSRSGPAFRAPSEKCACSIQYPSCMPKCFTRSVASSLCPTL